MIQNSNFRSFFQFLGCHYGFSEISEKLDLNILYNFWSSFDLLNLRALSKVEKKLLTLDIGRNLKFGNPCCQIPLTLPCQIYFPKLDLQE